MYIEALKKSDLKEEFIYQQPKRLNQLIYVIRIKTMKINLIIITIIILISIKIKELVIIVIIKKKIEIEKGK